MKKYLSFGGGVNSTALLILLTERGEKFETIFVDHGGDYPSTYAYIKYLKSKGFEITVLKPDVKGHSTIYDYSFKNQIIPSRRFRWCTDKFKIRPILRYIKKPCDMFIGFDAGESKRTFTSSAKFLKKDVRYLYPLIEAGMNRGDCINLIKGQNLDVPHKSGCWFCPFMRVAEVRELYSGYPDLFNKASALEENCMRKDLYIKDKPLIKYIKEVYSG